MVCCKITTNFSKGNFKKLLDVLSDTGVVLFDTSALYFYTDNENIFTKNVEKIIKKLGFGSCYVEEFTPEHLPNERDEINGWLLDGMTKISKKHIETESQKEWRILSAKMDILQKEINEEIERAKVSLKDDEGGK